MKRSDFIRGISLANLGAVLPPGRVITAAEELDAKTISCSLMPSDTDRAHPLDAGANSCVLRQDIRETKTGIPLNLKLKITDTEGEPIPNAWIKIWRDDKNGPSRHHTNSYPAAGNNANRTFLKGLQITDANGAAEFITIFPGWYSKKITQIHFRIYLNAVLAAGSQLTFPEKARNIIYSTGSLQAPYGRDPRSLATDNAPGNYCLQMATISPDITTGGYDISLQMTIDTIDSIVAQPKACEQCELQQNYPDPCSDETHIPFSIAQASDVEIEIYDLGGRIVTNARLDELPAGDHHYSLNFNSLGIAPGTYIYQLVVANEKGVFRQCKVMTGTK